jgi:dephospho-CoA kinase
MKSLDPKFIKLSPLNRLHGLDVPVIGLTGGIATGKSTVSKLLLKEGLPLIDADRLVKDVYILKETMDHLQKFHPEVLCGGKINFSLLRNKFFKDPKVREDIEGLIYRKLPETFHLAYEKLGKPSFVIYDVPLLFEKGLADKVDLKVLVYAPRSVQRARIMDRDGHPEEMAETILKHQMDIEMKRPLVDFIISNSAGMEELAVEITHFLRQVFKN